MNKLLFVVFVFLFCIPAKVNAMDIFGFKLKMPQEVAMQKIKKEGYTTMKEYNFITVKKGNKSINIGFESGRVNYLQTTSQISDFRQFVNKVKKNNDEYGDPFKWFTFTVPKEIVYKWNYGPDKDCELQYKYTLSDDNKQYEDTVLTTQ